MGFIKVYVDGACPGNGTASARGGWGVYIPSLDVEKCGRLPGRVQTNNRAELFAIKKGIEIAAGHGYRAQIHTDSDLCVKTFKQWATRWRANGWERSDGSRVENLDLVREIFAEYEEGDVDFVWVQGHSADRNNRRADELATQGARS